MKFGFILVVGLSVLRFLNVYHILECYIYMDSLKQQHVGGKSHCCTAIMKYQLEHLRYFLMITSEFTHLSNFSSSLNNIYVNKTHYRVSQRRCRFQIQSKQDATRNKMREETEISPSTTLCSCKSRFIRTNIRILPIRVILHNVHG